MTAPSTSFYAVSTLAHQFSPSSSWQSHVQFYICLKLIWEILSESRASAEVHLRRAGPFGRQGRVGHKQSWTQEKETKKNGQWRLQALCYSVEKHFQHGAGDLCSASSTGATTSNPTRPAGRWIWVCLWEFLTKRYTCFYGWRYLYHCQLLPESIIECNTEYRLHQKGR